MQTAKLFEVICSLDPAIDTERMTAAEMLRYIDSRDVSVLKFRSGERATRFYLKPISRETMRGFVMLGVNPEHRRARAFACAVTRVEQLRDEDSGKQIDVWEPANPAGSMTDDEANRFTPAEVEDIGGVAWDRSFLGPRNVRRYARQQSCLEHLDRLTFLPAAQSVAQTSSKKHSDAPASSASAEAQSAQSCDAPTDARATEAAT